MRGVAVVVCLAACGDNVKGAPDAAPPPSKLVYLNFEGASLSPGVSNSRANTAAFLQQSQDFPRFIPDLADRDARLDLLTSTLSEQLAPYDLGVVRERPTDPDVPYTMIVFTDTSQNTGFGAGAGGWITRCDDQGPNMVQLQFAHDATFKPHDVMAFAHSYLSMAALGWSAGIPFTTRPMDCMCFLAQDCTWPFTQACSLEGPDTPVDPDTTNVCPGTTYPPTIDVAAMFLDRLGSR